MLIVFVGFCMILSSLNSLMGFRTHLSRTHDTFMDHVIVVDFSSGRRPFCVGVQRGEGAALPSDKNYGRGYSQRRELKDPRRIFWFFQYAFFFRADFAAKIINKNAENQPEIQTKSQGGRAKRAPLAVFVFLADFLHFC